MKEWTEIISLNGQDIVCKIDTGAECNVISEITMNNIECKIDPCEIVLTAYGGNKIPTVGRIKLECICNKIRLKCDFYVVPLDVKTIIGLESSFKLRLVSPRRPVDSQHNTKSKHSLHQVGCNGKTSRHNCNGNSSKHSSQSPSTAVQKHNTPPSKSHRLDNPIKNTRPDCMKDILHKYTDVFDESSLGCMKDIKCDIRLKDKCEPKLHPPRKIPFAIKDMIKDELVRMENIGVITKVDKPTDWVSSMVVVRKPDQTIRICLDPRAYPTPYTRRNIC